MNFQDLYSKAPVGQGKKEVTMGFLKTCGSHLTYAKADRHGTTSGGSKVT